MSSHLYTEYPSIFQRSNSAPSLSLYSYKYLQINLKLDQSERENKPRICMTTQVITIRSSKVIKQVIHRSYIRCFYSSASTIKACMNLLEKLYVCPWIKWYDVSQRKYSFFMIWGCWETKENMCHVRQSFSKHCLLQSASAHTANIYSELVHTIK